MKILKNKFDVEIDRWDDPGDYPNGVASGPLPSYDYVADVPGELIVTLEDGDLDPEIDVDEQYEEIANAHANIPSGINVKEWAWSIQDNKLIISVNDFDASDYGPGPDDYDEEDY